MSRSCSHNQSFSPTTEFAEERGCMSKGGSNHWVAKRRCRISGYGLQGYRGSSKDRVQHCRMSGSYSRTVRSSYCNNVLDKQLGQTSNPATSPLLTTTNWIYSTNLGPRVERRTVWMSSWPDDSKAASKNYV